MARKEENQGLLWRFVRKVRYGVPFALLWVGVTASSPCAAGGASRCSADTVPIQIVGDERSGPETVFSATEISDPHFRTFVKEIAEHVAARLAKEQPSGYGRPHRCVSTAGKKRSRLQFVNWRIAIGDDPPALAPSLDIRTSGGCRITSPWVELAFERKPVPWVRGVVRWNERQMLVDQAMLAGARNVPTGLAMPLPQREFLRLAQDYSNSVLLHRPESKSIEAQIPPDLLWLFRHSPQDEIGFIGIAANAMDKAMEKGSERYTKLVIALIDRCFASDGADFHYSNIRGVGDLIPLEQYKIDTLSEKGPGSN